MGSESFGRVLAPGRIGGLELPNRIIMPAMDMNLCHDGMITPAEIAHYTVRAAGGAAMVITGSGAVAFPRGATSRHQPGLSDDRFVPGLAALADSVHAAGGRLCIQLCHHGKVAGVDTADGRPLLVPSAPVPGFALDALVDNPVAELIGLATATKGKSPSYRVADGDDLAWVIDQFADAAGRAQVAGCDAVEIHAAHGYLLSTFLSSAYNQRIDEWGGSPANRSRLTCEVVRAVRARVGAGFPILVRINGFEFGIEGGIDAADAVMLAPFIEASGADAIHVSANAHNPFADFTEGPLPSVIGGYRHLARAVKQAVGIPAIAVGRVLPELAEEMLAAGDCDFVSMGRQHLADPELVNKLAAGWRHSIRPCINCYVCVEQNFFDSPPRCAVNPALGNEARVSITSTKAALVRHVVVIGGGPAGMEVARLAARRGHRVTLLERSDRLGGSLWFAQLGAAVHDDAPGQSLVAWLEHEMADAGVEVRLATEATVDVVRDQGADVVVVATGAHTHGPAIPGVHLDHVYTVDELPAMIAGVEHPDASGPRIGRRIVVIGGGLIGLQLADFFVQRGCSVTVLEPGAHLGLPMAMPRRWAAVRDAGTRGVVLVRAATVESISERDVIYRVGGEQHTVVADSVIVAATQLAAVGVDGIPPVPLGELLLAAGCDVRAIGDAAGIGYIDGAIHSAWALAEQLDERNDAQTGLRR